MLIKVIILIVLNFNLVEYTEGYIGNFLKNVLRQESFSRNYIKQTVRNDGFQLEEHNVTTADGYMLTLHRIPCSFKSSCQKNLSPVYLFHGLLGCADTWIINGRGRSLAYILADAGYDVWLGNARGTTHSRRHRNLKPNSHDFWDFTWHEIGIYDNTANIDYILTATNKSKLHYIGHSQGTTTFFVMTSLRPEFNSKIKTMHALSPVAFMKFMTSPAFTIPANFFNVIKFSAKTFGLEEYLPNTYVISMLEKFLCTGVQPSENLCYRILAAIGGYNPNEANLETIHRFLKIVPAGASIYQSLHYSQLYLNGKFQSFDYGEEENMKKYNQKHPIEYPLKKVVSSPLFFYVSGNDVISALEDVKSLANGLPKKPVYIEIADKKWNHFDYLIGRSVKEMVYDRVLSDIRKADKKICDKFSS